MQECLEAGKEENKQLARIVDGKEATRLECKMLESKRARRKKTIKQIVSYFANKKAKSKEAGRNQATKQSSRCKNA